MIPIFIINLKRRPDRKDEMLNQLAAFNIQNYEFIEAVDGSIITDEYKKTVYDEKIARKIQWELNNYEIACSLSHRNVYNKMIAKGIKHAIILEDDAILTESFKGFINNLTIDNKRFDVIMLGYHTSNKIERSLDEKIVPCFKKVESNRSVAYFDEDVIELNGIEFYKFNRQSYRVDYLNGTYGYLVSNNFAHAASHNKIIVEADGIWNYNNFLIYGSVPPIVKVKFDDSDIVKHRLSTSNKQCSDFYYKRQKLNTFGK